MKKFILPMLIALVGVMGFTYTPAHAADYDFPTYADVNWSADGGFPILLKDGAVLYLYGDTVKSNSFTNNSAIIKWGNVTIPLWHATSLITGTDDSWYWPTDAIQQEDGSLLVLMNEVRKDSTSWFGFKGFDTDMFVVEDPYSVWSWKLAEHIDVGPWDGMNVSLISATEAVVRPLDSNITNLVDLTTPNWDVKSTIFTGRSSGTFIPVYHKDAWYGLQWDMASGHVDVLKSTSLINPEWTKVDEWDAPANSYSHQLHKLGDQIIYVYSPPGNGYELGQSTAFPVYEDITNKLTNI